MKIAPTIQKILYVVLLLVVSSCSGSQDNKENYNIKVGETFEIYYTSNSCCGRCWNYDKLENIEFIGVKTIEKSDLAGGTSRYAKIFRGTSNGVDTLRTHDYAISDSCNLNSKRAQVYIIHVAK